MTDTPWVKGPPPPGRKIPKETPYPEKPGAKTARAVYNRAIKPGETISGRLHVGGRSYPFKSGGEKLIPGQTESASPPGTYGVKPFGQSAWGFGQSDYPYNKGIRAIHALGNYKGTQGCIGIENEHFSDAADSLNKVGNLKIIEAGKPFASYNARQINKQAAFDTADYKEEPIEMVNVGTWISWKGDSSPLSSMDRGGNAPQGASGGSGDAPNPEAGVGARDNGYGSGGAGSGGGNRGGGGGGAGGGDTGGGGEKVGGSGYQGRAKTPFHDSHPMVERASGGHRKEGEGGGGYAGRAKTPYHDSHPALGAGHEGGVAPEGSTNKRLAAQRSAIVKSMQDPATRELVTKGLLAEGGKKGFLANTEQMMNYGNARGMTDAKKIMHSGFFGPINRGSAQRHRVTADERAVAERAFGAASRGSNIIDYRTDQGMPGDPNYRKEQNPKYRPTHVGGSFFADHPMFDKKGGSWAQRQKALDTAAGSGNVGGGDTKHFHGVDSSSGAPSTASGDGVTFTPSSVARTPHGQAVHGTLNVGGHSYPSVTGGAPGGVSVPPGDYNIGRGEIHPKLHGSSYHLTGRQYRGGGGGLFFHRGGTDANSKSQGCFHVAPRDFPAFEKDLSRVKNRTLHYPGPNTQTAKK